MTFTIALPHHGEEPPLSGTRGAGTIFFSSCNLRCTYCQNYQISHHLRGRRVSPQAMAAVMMSLQDRHCHNIEAVTPTPQIPMIIAALEIARVEGLVLPFIHNNGGYENVEVIKALKGWVDIYLPDFKYGSDETAYLYSGVKDYVLRARAAIREMASQVGDMLEIRGETAVRGLLVRHLVLPGRTAESITVLNILRSELSLRVPLSIMAQYTPSPAHADHPVMGRRLTKEEYETVIKTALDMGFEELYIQSVDDRHMSPDFDKENPFAGDAL